MDKNISIIEYNGDAYGSHMPVLERIFKTFDICSAVEFGMGKHSTPFLLINCCKVMSIEMQEEDWYRKTVKQLGENENWQHHLNLGAFEFLKLDYAEEIDFAFIDGHGDSRPECLNLMFAHEVPVIAAHDTEKRCYGWHRVKKPDNYEVSINSVVGKCTTVYIRKDWYRKQSVF